MAETVLPEKRTRSQVTLPDNILQVADASPMKVARTALKNPHLDIRSSSRTPVTDSEDELLLSPNKKGKHRRKQSRSKRTASPPPQDEYTTGSHSPLDGRELKRAKRDSSPTGEPSDASVDLPQNPKILLLQSTTPRHNRTNSEPNVPTVRRSNRKRSATTNKPPPSTASASPPRTLTTPPPSPGKGRAQSVPLFSTGSELPRVDFRKLPPSPKRARSRSRSPSKEREKLRMISGPSIPPPLRLPTIEDNEMSANMDVDETSSVPVEIELPHVYPTIIEVEPPVLPPIASSVEYVPETPRAAPTLPPPSQPITVIPFTPATQSLNKLIPLSPLTPLPETPWVGRVNLANAAAVFEGRIGWGLQDDTESQLSTNATDKYVAPVPDTAVASKTRLPRPPMAPPAVPPSKLRESSTIPPPRVPSRPQASTSKAPQPKNAFDLMMARKPPIDRKNVEGQKPLPKVKAIHLPSQPSLTSIFSNTKGKEKAVTPETGLKPTLKSKMKARSNVKEDKLVITVDEDVDDQMDVGREEHVLGVSTMSCKLDKKLDVAEEDIKQPPLETEVGQSQEQVPSQRKVNEDAAGPEREEPIDSAARTGGLKLNGDDVRTYDKTDGSSVNGPLSMVESPNIVAEPIVPPAEHQLEPELVTKGEEIQQVTAEPDLPPALPEDPTYATPTTIPTKPSKLPLGKKRVPSAPSAPSRVTRSVSKQKDAPEPQPVQKPPVRAQAKVPISKPPPSTAAAKRKVVGVAKKGTEKSVTMPVEPSTEESEPFLPGSPMKITTPGRPLRTSKSFDRLVGPSTSPIRPSMAKTPANSRILSKPLSTPSPAKIARATTALTSKPSVSSITQTFSMGVGNASSNAGSTLSTLSNALEKLRMPPPSRPNTSMGFNRGTTDDDNAGEGPSRSQDDATVGRTSIGLGRTESIIQRSATLGSSLFKPTIASSNKAAAANGNSTTKKNMVQKPLSMFMGKGAVIGGAGAGTPKFGGKFGTGPKPPLFANAPRRTISKKTSLPTLIGSPVKGGKASMAEEEEEDITMADDSSHPGQEQSDVSMSAASDGDSSMILEDNIPDGKGKAPASRSMHPPSSRILSVSHALSESLSALPRDTQPAKGGIMGPPATPPKKGGARSTTHSVSSGSPSTGGGVPTRSSSRIAKAAPAPSEVSVGPSSKKDNTQAAAPSKESLKILNDCVIFVDVKTDDGDEAGSLFVEMLEGVGAKVLSRVGQSCTHIVYKNGHSSTFTRYKLLRDPKPFIVGIGWVVECVEQRKHVEEKNFLVDLDSMNATSNNKRRRSILPRLLANGPSTGDTDREDEGDISMDGSTSSITIDDGITPLEKARRRQSILPSRP